MSVNLIEDIFFFFSTVTLGGMAPKAPIPPSPSGCANAQS